MRDPLLALPNRRRHLLAPFAALLLVLPLLGVPTTTASAQAGCDRQPAIDGGFTPLWDGSGDPTEQGWRQSGPGGFTVVDDGDGQGCRLLSEGGLGLLWYAETAFADYELRMQWRTEDETDNSGIFVGFPAAGGNTHNLAIQQGYEVQVREGTVGDGEDQKTGSIYNEQRELRRNANPPGEWNDYSITVERNEQLGTPTITVELNGEVVNVFQATDEFRAAGAGHIGLQNHGDNDAVSFRDIGIRALSDAQAPSTTHTLTTDGEQLPSGWYTDAVEVSLEASEEFGGSGLARTEYRLDGGEWTSYGPGTDVLFDGSQESFDRWRQAPDGSFQLMPDGTMHTVSGLGMLWYPVEYGDMVLRFEWRDLRPEVFGGSNSGVFVRFPDPDEAATRPSEEMHACQGGETRPAWIAINCGQEIQIYDGTGTFDFEPQKTGSVYNFSPLGIDEANPGTQGGWQDYEIRVEGGGDWTATIVRNGEVLQTWTNSPGQEASRAGDPPTDLRQFARGYIGLQNHSVVDHMQFRDVTVERLVEAEPLRIETPGPHTLEYRSVDLAGNVEPTHTLRVDIDPAPPTTTATVDQPGGSGPATVTLQPSDAGSGVTRTEYRIDGGTWTDYAGPTETLLGPSQASFDEWRMAGPGSFERQPDGSLVTRGGLGMLWHPKEFGDVRLSFEWRDLRTDGGRSNSGVFVRFPDPDEAAARPGEEMHACQGGDETRPEWVAIYCGQELQIYDGDTGETQKTGSVYNFQPLDLEQAQPTATGVWNTYTVELIGGGDYTATIARNGEVINTYTNTPGQQSSRSGDPGTSDRQFARGHIGLQNHGGSDLVQFRSVTATDLSPEAAAFVIDEPGTHTIEFRSYDAAGRVEAIQTLTVTV